MSMSREGYHQCGCRGGRESTRIRKPSDLVPGCAKAAASGTSPGCEKRVSFPPAPARDSSRKGKVKRKMLPLLLFASIAGAANAFIFAPTSSYEIGHEAPFGGVTPAIHASLVNAKSSTILHRGTATRVSLRMASNSNQVTKDDVSFFVLDDMVNSNQGKRWYYFADTVMGGVSRGQILRKEILGRPAMELQGTVSLENNGGFIQIAMDFNENGNACILLF
jgi:hypothetical protein